MNKKNKNKFGFTLFELLVTISIIAVMTAVAVVSFSGLNKKARDQRRVSDVEKIRIGLESYKQINNYYPTTLDLLVSGGFLDKLPVDPKSGLSTAYKYVPGIAPAATYAVCIPVELLPSVSSDGANCGTTPSGSLGYYRVIQP